MSEISLPCRDWILWGSAGHAKVLADLLALRGGRVQALFDNNLKTQSCLAGVPIFYGREGFAKWLSEQNADKDISAALAIGGTHGRDRMDLAQLLESAGLSLPPLTHPSASVAGSASVGAASQVLALAVLAADVVIGKACIVNNHTNVDHECVIGDGVHIGPGAVLCGCVEVGNGAMVGAGAVILPLVRIGADAIVGAGAVVTHDVPENSIVVGNPARLKS